MKNPAVKERGSRATVPTAEDIRRRAVREAVRELLVDYDLGVNDAARRLGIAAATVIRVRDELGIPPRPRGGRRRRPEPNPAPTVVIYRCRACGVPQPRERLCADCAHPLRAARVAAGMSQRQLADLIDSTPTAINAIEQRKKGVSPERAAKIAAALGTSVEEIFGDFSSYDGRPWLTQEREREQDALRAYCNRRGYATLADAATETGCSDYVLLRLLRARRYPGRWTSGGRPWLVRVADLDRVPQLLKRRRAERGANHALENIRRRSTGWYRDHPKRLAKTAAAQREYLADKAHRTAFVLSMAKGRKTTRQRPVSPDKMREWGNRWGAVRPTTERRGRRPKFTPEQAQRALALRPRHERKELTLAQIASKTGMTKSQVDYVYRTAPTV